MQHNALQRSWSERLPGLIATLAGEGPATSDATRHYLKQLLARMAELADRYEDLSR